MSASLALEGADGDWQLRLGGDWSLAATLAVETQVNRLPASLAGKVTCDWSDVANTGIGSAWLLLARLTDSGALPADVRHVGNPPHFLDLLRRLSHARHEARHHFQPPGLERLVGGLGEWAVGQGAHARAVVEFFGRIVVVCAQVFSRPRALRVTSLARHMYETGVTAIPIVSLIAFLISVIIAYLGAQQLSRFGADIFVSTW